MRFHKQKSSPTIASGVSQADTTVASMQPVTFSFWLQLLWLSLTRKRLSKAVEAAESFIQDCRVSEHHNLPAAGSFVLACNHYLPSTVLRTLSAALVGVSMVRPEVVDQVMIVAGSDNNRKRRFHQRIAKFLMDFIYRKWTKNLVVIPLGNGTISLSALREWRRRAALQPVFVFPEGHAAKHFRQVRPGAGRWLRGLGVPVIPIAVWHQDRCWHVRFGPAVNWSGNDDMQLGLAIAKLLPAELAPEWSAACQVETP